MKRRVVLWAVVATLAPLFLAGCSKPAVTPPLIPADIVEHSTKTAERIMPKRGSSYYLKLPSDDYTLFLQMRGLRDVPEFNPATLSEAEHLNGITERYDVTWGEATVMRVLKFAPEEELTFDDWAWSEWVDLKDSQNSYLQEAASPGLEVFRKGAVASVFDPKYDRTQGPQYKRDRLWLTHRPAEFTADELAKLPR